MNTSAYYNTNQIIGQTLINFYEAAKSQEQKVYDVYLNTNKGMAWFNVAAYLPTINHCSIKRSISNLAKKGLLVKDTRKETMVIGLEGKPCHLYMLNQ
jgi:predicted transcriptional regulator